MQFLLRCPKCKNTMMYQLMTPKLIGKRKVCVYCGKSFTVQKNLVNKVKGNRS